MRKIHIVPLGPVDQDLLVRLRSSLQERLGVETALEEPVPLSETWYDSRRRQYLGNAVLNALSRIPRQRDERVLGLIDRDCYATGLNFIFGQAAIRGGLAFVALPRLRQSFYGLPEDWEVFRLRALKESVHELGHTWGLGHCSNPRCVMHFSNRLEDTDYKDADFCDFCKRKLGLI